MKSDFNSFDGNLLSLPGIFIQLAKYILDKVLPGGNKEVFIKKVV